ncbi:hypothetical protein HYW58_01965 [Candidatus Kaiserbacteria bacterium]|nr:hypothetical protein [Candidatus Kaiserbacteria bacterium]
MKRVLNLTPLFSVLLAGLLTLGACATAVDSIVRADKCSQGEAREGFIAYKLCVWQNVGPAQGMVWGSSNSRDDIRQSLYKEGALHVGEFPITVGLRGLKPNMRVVLFGTTKTGEVTKREETSSQNGEINPVLRTHNGEGTLWVSQDALTSKHFVKIWSSKPGVKLEYNNPSEKYFTKPGEDIDSQGKPKYPATRLNTKVPPQS